MAYSSNCNEGQRSRFLHHAQQHRIDASKNFAQRAIQSTFLTSDTGIALQQNPHLQQLLKDIAEHGYININEQIRLIVEKACKEPLLIAVTGETGVGKSTLINTMRNLSPNDPGAAKTNSSKQCTMEVKAYPDPKNPDLLIYYDLPGIGAPEFPKETYAEKVSLSRYDFFIILSNDRFKDDDLYLVNEIKQLGKKFYFVRTQIDVSISKEQDDNDATSFNEEDYINEVRKDTKDTLLTCVGDHPVFVISGKLKSYGKWDFPKFVQTLINNTPNIKKEIIVRTVFANSQEVIDEKIALFESRIYIVAIAAAAIGAVPIFMLSISCNLGIITNEVNSYMKDFGLDEVSMEKLAKKYGMDRAELQKKIFGDSDVLKSNSASVIADVLQKILTEAAAVNIASECARFTPIIGQLVPSVSSFVTVSFVLRKLLRETGTIAMKLVDELIILAK